MISISRSMFVGLMMLTAAAGSALTQPAPQAPPDPAFLQKALQALQIQRNTEADQRAIAEARASMLQEEVTKLQKELTDLKKSSAPPSVPPASETAK
jgi:hypothetical protein